LKRIAYLSLFLAIGCLFPFTAVHALDTNFEASIGYDDNPAEVDDMDGSGFARYRILLEQSIYENTKGLGTDIFFDARTIIGFGPAHRLISTPGQTGFCPASLRRRLHIGMTWFRMTSAMN
jgi:hypothetical protein